MDKFISLSYQPFVYEQNIMIYQDGMSHVLSKAEEDNIASQIFALCNLKDIFNVKLSGPQMFTSKVKQDIEDIEILTYGNKKIEVEQY